MTPFKGPFFFLPFKGPFLFLSPFQRAFSLALDGTRCRRSEGNHRRRAPVVGEHPLSEGTRCRRAPVVDEQTWRFSKKICQDILKNDLKTLFWLSNTIKIEISVSKYPRIWILSLWGPILDHFRNNSSVFLYFHHIGASLPPSKDE